MFALRNIPNIYRIYSNRISIIKIGTMGRNIYTTFFCPSSIIQKQPPRGVPRKRCSENMQQIYRRTPMPKCDLLNGQNLLSVTKVICRPSLINIQFSGATLSLNFNSSFWKEDLYFEKNLSLKDFFRSLLTADEFSSRTNEVYRAQ